MHNKNEKKEKVHFSVAGQFVDGEAKPIADEENLLPVVLKRSVSRIPSVTIPIDRYDSLVKQEAICDLIEEVRQRVNRSDFERFICMVFPKKINNNQAEGTENA